MSNMPNHIPDELFCFSNFRDLLMCIPYEKRNINKIKDIIAYYIDENITGDISIKISNIEISYLVPLYDDSYNYVKSILDSDGKKLKNLTVDSVL